MTRESFQHKIKKIYKTDNITNYVVSFLFFGMGVYFLFKIIIDGLPTQEAPEKYMILIVPLIPITAALYAIWRIPKDYIVHQVDSQKTLEEKLELIELYLSDKKILWMQVEGGYRSYRYANNFFSKVDVRFFIDEKKVLINVQGADTSGLKGVIDFGLTSRATKRLKEYLEASL